MNKNYKEGIHTRLDKIMMEFNLREKGYSLNFTLDDLKVNLFRKSLLNSEDLD